MESQEFKVEVEQVPRPVERVRPRIRDFSKNDLVNQAVDRILGIGPQVTVAAFQSSI